MKRFTSLLCASGLSLCQATALPVVKPASEGFSEARLDRLHQFMRGVTDSGNYLGAVTLVARNGKIVAWRAFGHRDLAKTSPMDPSSIFRIYSMTKTVTSVAVLTLMEEGKFTLEDPIGRYLPEFANMQVFVGGTADAPQLRPAARPITVRHLLTHTAGFAAGGNTADEVVKIFNRVDFDRLPDLKTYSERLGRLPLAVDPGERFNYDGVSIEPLSRLIEVVAGMPFDAFVQQGILDPLRLEDTGFSVPAEKRGRIADMTSTDRNGRLILASAHAAQRPGDMIKAYPGGSGGLYSTAADYARFCQMLLNGGELDGVAILDRSTVELMMQNHLAHLDPPTHDRRGAEGFGLGGYVVLDVARRGQLGSVGQFGWLGAASTYYTIDREEQLIAILMMQHLPQGLPRDPPKISANFFNLVYQSLVK
ncbi:MAG: serine hydrolase domain-containing protein [Gammaproteobacteria bacterium]